MCLEIYKHVDKFSCCHNTGLPSLGLDERELIAPNNIVLMNPLHGIYFLVTVLAIVFMFEYI